jgi:PhnB protein
MKTRKAKSVRKPKAPAARRPAARKRRGGVAGRRTTRRTHKPQGYTSVAPYLVVAGAQRVLDFVKQVFGAVPLRRFDMPDGTVMHAEVRIDDTVVMLGDAGPEWPPIPAFLHVYVPDVDAVYGRALEAGGVSVQVPVQKPGDPDKRGGVKDPAGNTWWISTQVA